MIKWLLHTIPRPVLIRLSYWVRPLLILWFRGNRYTDPIDGRSFRRFLPYGYHIKRPNVLSPSTLSLERHRLLWLYLKGRTDFFSAALTILHIAPEQAFFHLFKKQKNWNYITADLESPLADVKADLCDLPFENNSFDVIFCNHVLEHIVNDIKAMQELYRVMKPGGWGVFQVPLDMSRAVTFQDDTITDPKKRAQIFGQYDHVRIYGRDYSQRLRHVGFQVEMVDFTQCLSDEEIDRYRVVKGELIPVVKKVS